MPTFHLEQVHVDVDAFEYPNPGINNAPLVYVTDMKNMRSSVSHIEKGTMFDMREEQRRNLELLGNIISDVSNLRGLSTLSSIRGGSCLRLRSQVVHCLFKLLFKCLVKYKYENKDLLENASGLAFGGFQWMTLVSPKMHIHMTIWERPPQTKMEPA
ncbi:hypothetical protein BO78DRAFT_420639 [Aspergillus sclerotiicarbonarius CBS 121057]|uniref:Uncharacterized protein n=1 Tax=Aspergillus sclerotiicarbonarius (strain CBS 121057 / IBT 28362) TaxID=1448318 RepID=A0A319ED56_ASPSB|nr:hypothetical protein BO78DRAFT_420639 [Aspergillus sclerotiicarbonarius CBS 121057]